MRSWPRQIEVGQRQLIDYVRHARASGPDRGRRTPTTPRTENGEQGRERRHVELLDVSWMLDHGTLDTAQLARLTPESR